MITLTEVQNIANKYPGMRVKSCRNGSIIINTNCWTFLVDIFKRKKS